MNGAAALTSSAATKGPRDQETKGLVFPTVVFWSFDPLVSLSLGLLVLWSSPNASTVNPNPTAKSHFAIRYFKSHAHAAPLAAW